VCASACTRSPFAHEETTDLARATAQRQRTGPRIEAAKALCGTTSLSSASPQQQLVASTLAGDVGYELLQVFTDAGGGSGMPVFPAPLLDYVALLSRFDAACVLSLSLSLLSGEVNSDQI